jgi:hypothetical protein
VLPLLWWWLQPAPRGRAAGFGALAIALAGIWIGGWLLPDENKQVWLWLEPLRWVVIGALLYQGVNLLADLSYAWLDPRVRLR